MSALKVSCPTCGAKPGHPCLARDGVNPRPSHYKRWDRWNAIPEARS